MTAVSKVMGVTFVVLAWSMVEALISDQVMESISNYTEDRIASNSLPGMRNAERDVTTLLIHGEPTEDQLELLLDMLEGLRTTILQITGPPAQCENYRDELRRNVIVDRSDPQLKASMKFGTVAEDVCISKDPAGRDGVSFQSYCMACMLNNCLSDKATCRCRAAIGGDKNAFVAYVAGRLYNDCGGPFSTNYCEQERLANILYNVQHCL